MRHGPVCSSPAPYARRLIGVDISGSMLKKAAGRRLYDDLIKAELTEFLGRQAETYDVVVSADTLCYFGKLEPVFHAAAKALKEGGILAFTLEDGAKEYRIWRLLPNADTSMPDPISSSRSERQVFPSVRLRL